MPPKKAGFEKLDAYQKSFKFAVRIHQLLAKTEQEPFITYQLKRSSVSIPLNIAEGTGALTKRDYLNYVNIAYKSLLEAKANLQLCWALNYFNKKDFSEVLDMWCDLRETLFGLRMWLMKRCRFKEGDKMEFAVNSIDKLEKEVNEL